MRVLWVLQAVHVRSHIRRGGRHGGTGHGADLKDTIIPILLELVQALPKGLAENELVRVARRRVQESIRGGSLSILSNQQAGLRTEKAGRRGWSGCRVRLRRGWERQDLLLVEIHYRLSKSYMVHLGGAQRMTAGAHRIRRGMALEHVKGACTRMVARFRLQPVNPLKGENY